MGDEAKFEISGTWSFLLKNTKKKRNFEKNNFKSAPSKHTSNHRSPCTPRLMPTLSHSLRKPELDEPVLFSLFFLGFNCQSWTKRDISAVAHMQNQPSPSDTKIENVRYNIYHTRTSYVVHRTYYEYRRTDYYFFFFIWPEIILYDIWIVRRLWNKMQ